MIVAVRIVGLQGAQAVLDGDGGGDDEKAAAVEGAARPTDGVDRLPGDELGHHNRLAAAGGHLHGEAEQAGISAALDGGLIERLAVAVERVVAGRRAIGRVEDRAVEEAGGHGDCRLGLARAGCDRSRTR